MASLHTKAANRKRLAAAAMEKIENAQRPHPMQECGETLEKNNDFNS